MKNTVDKDDAAAFRKRIQGQALYHRRGQSVAWNTIMRFRKAGTWDGEITQDIHPSLLPLLTEKDSADRLPLPGGPLVVSADGGVINVADHLLSQDAAIRCAALRHFLGCDHARWISPYVLNLIKEHQEALASQTESAWLNAGLSLQEAIDSDFRINCAGVKQGSYIRHGESYQKYLSRVVRPKARCFDHDRPPTWDPRGEPALVRAHIRTWSENDDLNVALDSYLECCGYVPLCGDLSLGELVAAWQKNHVGIDVWEKLWSWAESCPSVLAEYHVSQALLERPEWIRTSDADRLVRVCRGIISSAESGTTYENAPHWQLRSRLAQHYQLHLESVFPGLNGEVVAVSVGWIAEMVSQLFARSADHVKKGAELLEEEVLPLSWRRWTMARSRVGHSSLRSANLHSSFIWADSLLATAIRRFGNVPACGDRESFREFLASRMISALYLGNLRTVESEPVYAFERSISLSDLGMEGKSDEGKTIHRDADFVFSARKAIETADFREILLDLGSTPAELSEITSAALCLHVVLPKNTDSAVRALLADNDWRAKVFDNFSIEALHNFVSFLIEWQLRQSDDWVVRLPQILAFECERAVDQERIRMLFLETLVSSMAGDISSPTVRLLTGNKRSDCINIFGNWCETTRQLALHSEPWLKARIRGFVGATEWVM